MSPLRGARVDASAVVVDPDVEKAAAFWSKLKANQKPRDDEIDVCSLLDEEDAQNLQETASTPASSQAPAHTPLTILATPTPEGQIDEFVKKQVAEKKPEVEEKGALTLTQGMGKREQKLATQLKAVANGADMLSNKPLTQNMMRELCKLDKSEFKSMSGQEKKTFREKWALQVLDTDIEKSTRRELASRGRNKRILPGRDARVQHGGWDSVGHRRDKEMP